MHALEVIERRTAELMVMGLKSSAAVIQRVCPLIGDARQAGFSHRAIYEALGAAGLKTTWTNYRIALGRAIKATSQAPGRNDIAVTVDIPRPTVEPRHVIKESGLTSNERQMAAEIARGAPTESDLKGFRGSSAGTSTTTRVMDALRQAREVANSKDYGQIGRDLYRQKQRDERRKDRP